MKYTLYRTFIPVSERPHQFSGSHIVSIRREFNGITYDSGAHPFNVRFHSLKKVVKTLLDDIESNINYWKDVKVYLEGYELEGIKPLKSPPKEIYGLKLMSTNDFIKLLNDWSQFQRYYYPPNDSPALERSLMKEFIEDYIQKL